MKTILFSSTRQWNPGDEFIQMGVRNLLDDVECNVVLYNRHPIVSSVTMKCDGVQIPPVLDNSYLHFPDSMDCIDYVIFSGTPEWTTFRMKVLFDLLDKKNLKFSMLGVGGSDYINENGIPEILIKNMGNAELVTGRDEGAFRLLHKYGCQLEVCPALFSASYSRQRSSLSSIGIIYQGGNYVCSVDQGMQQDLINLYKAIINQHGAKVVCHNYMDFVSAMKEFPGAQVIYSSYAEDYIGIFDEFDLLVGTRVHGAGVASSLGIPSIFIMHDDRSETVRLFKSHMVTPETISNDSDSVLELINNIDIQRESMDLITYKEAKKSALKQLLSRTSLYK